MYIGIICKGSNGVCRVAVIRLHYGNKFQALATICACGFQSILAQCFLCITLLHDFLKLICSQITSLCSSGSYSLEKKKKHILPHFFYLSFFSLSAFLLIIKKKKWKHFTAEWHLANHIHKNHLFQKTSGTFANTFSKHLNEFLEIHEQILTLSHN